VRSINEGVVGSEKKGTDGKDDILVPLTSSLYVKGKLADREKVLVDVGTGFYVEKVFFLITISFRTFQKLMIILREDYTAGDPVLRGQGQESRVESHGVGKDCANKELSAKALRRG
jgi:hypothetical protein